MDIVDKLSDDDCDTADHYEAAAEIICLRKALRLLLDECEASGNATAQDFGWPKAIATARSALASNS
jgi:hypothetical protein